MKDFVITRKKITQKKRISSNGERCEKISRDDGGKRLVEREKEEEEEDGGFGRRVRREEYLVPVFPVMDCPLDLVPGTCGLWLTAHCENLMRCSLKLLNMKSFN